VADLATWLNPAGRDDRFTICNVALFAQRSLELLAASTEATLAFCIHSGLALLSQLPGVDEIRRAREVVLASGSDEIAWFEAWHFDIDPLQTTRTKLYGRVVREDADWAGALAKSLGLTRSTLATLAILAVLLHVPAVPEDYRRHMVMVLRDFAAQLKVRARRAKSKAKEASAPKEINRYSWADVIGEEEQ
jgi:hypothetical protein